MATWLITGAARGIGLGICKELLARGETVIGACRNPDGARDLWELASDFKDRYRTVQLDVSDQASIQRLAKDLSAETIDILVNNAGVLYDAESGFKTLNFAELTKSFEVNTFGPMYVTRALLPQLERAKLPKVVHITSKMGSIADNRSGGHYAYRMSKTALNMFHSCFAAEFPKIVSLVLHPGWVQTQMGGEQAPVQVIDSAEGLVNVIQRAGANDSGSFMDYQGVRIPW